MLEQMADFDDRLMEELINEKDPARDHIMSDLADEMGRVQIVPGLPWLGRERFWRAPPAQGAAPRNAEARRGREAYRARKANRRWCSRQGMPGRLAARPW